MKSMKFFLIAAFTALSALTAFTNLAYAQTDRVTLTVDVKSTREVYQKQFAGDTELNLVSSESNSTVGIQGTGVFENIKNEQKQNDESVIGKDLKGHATLTLESNGSTVYVVEDVFVDDEKNGLPIKISYHVRAPAQFVSGNWNDYQANKNVSLRLTKEGAEMAAEAKWSSMKFFLRQAREALAQAVPQYTFSDFKVESSQGANDALIKGNQDQLVVTSGHERLVLSLEATANENTDQEQ